MEMPSVVTVGGDPRINFVFRVRAYRKLTRQEMQMAFAVWNGQRDKRRTLKNKHIEIVSLLGSREI